MAALCGGARKTRATLLGLLAIVLWSTLAGLIRSLSEQFGPTGGAAMIYTVSAVFLLALAARPRVAGFRLKYMLTAGLLFASYEICSSLSLGYAASREQSIEVGMINYLWPSLTVLLAMMMNGAKGGAGVYTGLLLALTGIVWLMCGDGGWTPRHMLDNVLSNPLSYGLALGGALIWAVYCNVTRRFAGGQHGVTLFFILTALLLWVKYLFSNEPGLVFSGASVVALLVTGAVMGIAYASWNIGIINGNMTLLAACSYFTPVLSSLFAATLLHIHLTGRFWQGVALVCCGSLLCWLTTRERPVAAPAPRAESGDHL
ncbi:aromatic amino acid DMT transporter YddG [Sodalis sp. RH24]|uniref:aromatic amino acid DMT transporter YddG n=1 Tax=unclassified Sodalis (in: enterobacteria) TaxID=2636512 RepID=UPI003965C5B5